ncbi:HAD domain-containing protein [Arthrobacter sp. ZGTC412]|uniref:HAD domain-containing protein n=1 Tax=Arthrobacter sp. ZGTC412 TaxID=2058900 RepID=UPI000CE2C7E9|nr:HAD domain-containing protein [Arthrobacter sp. ZGTC412]
MKPIILLDVDGVLNPKVHHGDGDSPDLHLSDAKVALVRRLATKGRIAWVTTSPADVVADLDAQLELDVEPLRVTVEMQDSDAEEPTPKLSSVARWLERMEAAGEADWDSVVWIDDVLGPDVHDWAHHLNQPVLLEKPVPEEGLTEAHVVAVQVFIDGETGRKTDSL